MAFINKERVAFPINLKIFISRFLFCSQNDKRQNNSNFLDCKGFLKFPHFIKKETTKKIFISLPLPRTLLQPVPRQQLVLYLLIRWLINCTCFTEHNDQT